MHYEKAVEGAPEEALARLLDTFLQVGFKAESRGAYDFEVRGPGMHSTKQNALVGVSYARAEVSGNTLRLRADLGGVRFMQRFVVFFPPLLIAGLSVIFLITNKNAPVFVWNAAPLLALQFIVVGVAMAFWIRRRTERAIDVALDNAILLSRPL